MSDTFLDFSWMTPLLCINRRSIMVGTISMLGNSYSITSSSGSGKYAILNSFGKPLEYTERSSTIAKYDFMAAGSPFL